MTVRNLSQNVEDFIHLVGKTVINGLSRPVGVVVDVISEHDAYWHHDNIFMVTDVGERIFINKIVKEYSRSVQVAY